MVISKKFLVFGGVAIVAMLFVTFFSYTTSPLYHSAGDTPDSPIFQIIGKYWAEGAVPYRDLWDLKGPFIFFMNAIGYWLTGSSLGVWLLQVLCMAVTIYALLKISTLQQFNTSTIQQFNSSTIQQISPSTFLLVLLSLAGLSYMYEGGNLTEEYVLPLLSWSFYAIFVWLKGYTETGMARHRPAVTILYGATFGLCLMSRLTNALALCGAIMVITVVLLKDKNYRNLLVNAAAFLAGFSLTTLPFFLYFHLHHALGEMWNATFVYAVEYAGNSSLTAHHPSPITHLHYFLLSYIGSILLLCVILYKAVSTRCFDVSFWMWTMSAGLPLVWFCQGNGFGHYGMTVFPLLVIALMEIERLHLAKLRIVIVALLLLGCASKVRHLIHLATIQRINNSTLQHINISTSPLRSSFVAYNCDPRLYLDEDIRPAVPFFALQDFAVSRNPLLREHVINAFMEKKPQWILLSYDSDETTVIRDVLEQYYTPVATDEEHHLRLLRLK